MFDVLHSYLNDQIVAPTHQKCSPDLWDRFRLIEESIDYSSLMLGQLDKEKALPRSDRQLANQYRHEHRGLPKFGDS